VPSQIITAVFLSGISLNNSNEIINFRGLDPNTNGAVLESPTRKKRPQRGAEAKGSKIKLS
jgi:hypothetical protein